MLRESEAQDRAAFVELSASPEVGTCIGSRPRDELERAMPGVATAESVRPAFVATLQHLPAKQRATLILRDVLGFSTREVAELHGSTVASINSALQRARATLADRREQAGGTGSPASDGARRVLAERYATAFSRYDMEELTTARLFPLFDLPDRLCEDDDLGVPA
ncbi:sigma factor-like helix-turn-helix DNA-binding protein [Streptomyces sp. NPDC033754]|uniref:sigma factor-like helix-turn-helix DNA-binding protein n=1 Tax=Streptomyces sp. NPDC033754 TaxID=3365318 RepID=UPI00384B5739